MKIQIKNRWTNNVLFECEQPDTLPPRQALGQALGQAVLEAIKVGASLRNASLDGASLDGASLVGASISIRAPKVERLHQRILAAIEAGGSLDMNSWHACETTHCRAGWAIHLAGQAGDVLESCVGAEAAGALISLASCPQLEGKVPNFFATAEEALADIKRLAALEG